MALDLVKYLKIQYQHLGRGWVKGDCFNLGLLFYKTEFGIEAPDFTDYVENWSELGKDYFKSMYKEYGFKLLRPTDQYQFGDVLFLTTRGAVSHIGIVVDSEQGYFIHTTKLGTAVHNYLVGEWATRVYGAIRYKRKLHAN